MVDEHAFVGFKSGKRKNILSGGQKRLGVTEDAWRCFKNGQEYLDTKDTKKFNQKNAHTFRVYMWG